MANNKIDILLGVDDKATAKLNKFTGGMKKNWLAIAGSIALVTIAVKRLTEGVVKASKEVVRVNARFETWGVTMLTFTKNTAEAKKKLKELIDFSVRTPFTPGEVIEAGLMLKPLEELGFELNDLVLAAGNLKEAFNFRSLVEAADNLSRGLSAGVASAEQFRNKGVRMFLEVQEGVDIANLSLEKQREILMDTFTTGKIGGAIERASKTFEGLWSTLEGEFLLFKQAVGEDIFEDMKISLETVLGLIKESKEAGGEYEETVKKISDGFSSLLDTSFDAFRGIVWGIAQAADGWNEFEVAMKQIELNLKEFEKSAREVFIKIKTEIKNISGDMPDDPLLRLTIMMPDLQVLQEVNDEIAALQEELGAALADANIDHSNKINEMFDTFTSALEEKKEAIKAAEEAITDVVEKEGEVRNAIRKKEVDYFAGSIKRGEALAKKSAENTLGTMASVLKDAAEMNAAFGRAYQVVAISEAIISTHAGVARAFKDYAFPASAIVAGIVAAAGAVEIAGIASQKFEAGTDNVPSIGGITHPGEIVVPKTFSEAIRRGDLTLGGEGGGGGDTNIYITIDGMNSDGGSMENVAETLGFEVERAVRTARGI